MARTYYYIGIHEDDDGTELWADGISAHEPLQMWRRSDERWQVCEMDSGNRWTISDADHEEAKRTGLAALTVLRRLVAEMEAGQTMGAAWPQYAEALMEDFEDYIEEERC